MIEAKADLSIKFSEMPIVKSEGKKSVALTFKTAIGPSGEEKTKLGKVAKNDSGGFTG